MAGFWDKVPTPSTLVPVTQQQFFKDLVAFSDQNEIVGWQARDSYFRLRSFALAEFAKHNQVLTWDQLFLYYISDPTMNLGIVASAVALDTQDLKQPRYARMTYVLDPTTGWITDFGVHIFSRWTFYNVPQRNHVAPVPPAIA
jgi:hypothetical protein